jgi:hypothetical protein
LVWSTHVHGSQKNIAWTITRLRWHSKPDSPLQEGIWWETLENVPKIKL